MNKTMLDFDFSTHAVEKIQVAGKFSMYNRDHDVKYCLGDRISLHLYEYSGKIRLENFNVEYEIKPGDMTILPPNAVSSYQIEPDSGFHSCIHFQMTTGGAMTLPLLLTRMDLPSGTADRVEEICALFHEEAFRPLAASALNLLLFRLWRHQKKKAFTLQHHRIAQILESIRNCPEQEVDLKFLAGELKLSPIHLGRLLKQATGVPLSKFVMRQRIDKAKTLLTSSCMSLKEIAIAVGYSGNQEFYKRFRQLENLSPGQFRNGSCP